MWHGAGRTRLGLVRRGIRSSGFRPVGTGLIVALGLGIGVLSVSADEFERIEGAVLSRIVAEGASDAGESLTVGELAAIRPVLEGERSPLVIVKTGAGNPSRLLVAPALRKPEGGGGEAVPILLIERFDTFEAGPATTRLSGGRAVVLFDGMGLDLDTGQVVPEGFGADLRFTSGEDLSAGKFEAVGGASLFVPNTSPLAGLPAPPGPSPGRTILAGDFSGRYHLDADGRWTGELSVQADLEGSLSGRFRSDETGASYPLRGRIGPEPNRLTFGIDLPRARLEFDGRLFATGKRRIAGTVALEGQVHGFVAERESRESGTDAETASDAPESSPGASPPRP